MDESLYVKVNYLNLIKTTEIVWSLKNIYNKKPPTYKQAVD